MAFSITTATKKIAGMSKRIRAIQGGTSASKTISVLLYLIARAQGDKKPTVTSVVSESLPHLKRGAIKDFLKIMGEHGYFKDDLWNKTDFVYTFETGSKLEFFGADSPDKVRGPRRDRLFMNECNNLARETFEQLEVRTTEFVFLDWNPTNEFWFYDLLKPGDDFRDDIEHIIITYLDNEALPESVIKSIEQRKNRAGWWRVYGMGLLGEVEGKVYKDWSILDEIPHEARIERYGIDFGFNDPACIVAVYWYNGGWILDEVLYKSKLTNKDLIDTIKTQERHALCVGDSAEPKSIEELRRNGINIVGAVKGRDSVKHGIQLVQQERISVTSRSENIIREYKNYMWQLDDHDKPIEGSPEHAFSHCFSPDTMVHTTEGRKAIESLVGKEGYVYSRDGTIQRFFDVKPTRYNAEMVNITFDDGDTLSVTPDHLLLQLDGTWIEAGLLCTNDMIQSGIYETGVHLQRDQILQIPRFKILQGVCQWGKEILTSLHLGSGAWGDTQGISYSSHRPQSREQHNRQSSTNPQEGTSKTPLGKSNRGRKTKEKRLDKKDFTTYKEMAWVRRGSGMAQVTWEESVSDENYARQRMFSLSQSISNKRPKSSDKILSPELQNESQAKTIKGITRGFCPVTYNLEVENTHCLLANGVIAHNSMDAIRYALNSVIGLAIDDMEDSWGLYKTKYR